jgi:hypothetical protein
MDAYQVPGTKFFPWLLIEFSQQLHEEGIPNTLFCEGKKVSIFQVKYSAKILELVELGFELGFEPVMVLTPGAILLISFSVHSDLLR